MNAPAKVTLATIPPEQARYAAWLEVTSRLGLAVLVVTYFAYVFGLMPPQVPLDSLPELWRQSAATFAARTGSPTGWGWLALLNKGDMVNFLGIAFLAGGSVLCLAAVIPSYARHGGRFFAVVSALLIAVLALAASGLLGSGH